MNGMYYHALDYIYDLETRVTVILNKKYFKSVPKELQGHDVKILNFVDYLIYSFSYRNEKFITPTPHPIPWLKNQIIILHDVYPFKGRIGSVKKSLIKISYLMNRYEIGIVNRSILLPFLNSLRYSRRYFFLPNKVEILERTKNTSPKKNIERIGLFGADSEKKNYHILFDHTAADLQYFIYGKTTNYTEYLVRRYHELDINVVDSSLTTVEGFLSLVDCVVSVSTEEGFGRLNLLSIQKGVPVILLESPVTREFYQEFHDTSSGITIAQTVGEVTELLNNPSLAHYSLNCLALSSTNNEFKSGINSLKSWINNKC